MEIKTCFKRRLVFVFIRIWKINHVCFSDTGAMALPGGRNDRLRVMRDLFGNEASSEDDTSDDGSISDSWAENYPWYSDTDEESSPIQSPDEEKASWYTDTDEESSPSQSQVEENASDGSADDDDDDLFEHRQEYSATVTSQMLLEQVQDDIDEEILAFDSLAGDKRQYRVQNRKSSNRRRDVMVS